jgi:hypothetical protein
LNENLLGIICPAALWCQVSIGVDKVLLSGHSIHPDKSMNGRKTFPGGSQEGPLMFGLQYNIPTQDEFAYQEGKI